MRHSSIEKRPIEEKKVKKKANTQKDLLFHQPVDCLNANNCKFVQRFENVHTAATTHKVLASDLQFAIQCGNSCRGFLWKYTPSVPDAPSSSSAAAGSSSRTKAKPVKTGKTTAHATYASSSSSSAKKKDYVAATAKVGKPMSSSSASAGARGASSSSAGGGNRNHSSSSGGGSNNNGSQPRYQPAMKQPRNLAAHYAATMRAKGNGAQRPSPSQTYYEGTLSKYPSPSQTS